jgi:hypothetical protein
MQNDKNLLTITSFAKNQTARYFREGSFAIATVTAIGAFGYILFTILLLDSSPTDRIGGIMFLANIPFVIGLTAFALLSKRIALFFALGAAGIQAVITVALLLVTQFTLAFEVLCINGPILLLLLAIAFWISHSDHKHFIANLHGSNVG